MENATFRCSGARKGNLFTLDAVIAVLLLIATAVIIINQLPEEKDDYYTDRMATDIINVLAHTDVDDLCSAAACSCPNYPRLQTMVCSGMVQSTDMSLLDLFSELILTGAASQPQVERAIHEIFVEKGVIDEQRFGFTIMYTMPGMSLPLELYNSDTYIP